MGAALVLLDAVGEVAMRRVHRLLRPLGVFGAAMMLGAIIFVCVVA
jgi:hypothetical protein